MEPQARILLIDDDETLVPLLRIMLEHEGFAVLTASGGAAGLTRALEEAPDLVLLDVMMPEVDGWQVLAELRRNPRWGKKPVIMLTARVEEADRVKGLEEGADDYVCKPFSNRELVARVRKELRRSQIGGRQEFVSGPLSVNFENHNVRVSGLAIHLTPTEWRLLSALLTQPGRVVTFEELLHAGWQDGRHATIEGLKVQIHHLRRKLAHPECPNPWIVTERNNGYRFQIDAERAMLDGLVRPEPKI